MRVSISGTIVSNDDKWLYDWYGYDSVCPDDVRQAIANNPEGETLTVAINSGGGDVFAGFEMYTMLRQAKCHTVAEVESLAASAASTAMIGCDEVLLSPVAQVMIHLPACGTYGDENAHRESLGELESVFVSILNGYELRCRGKADREQLDQLMRSTTWMPVQDALALGLADGILGDSEGLTMASRFTNAACSLGGLQMPSKAALLAEYHRRVANGAAPAAGHEIGSVTDMDALADCAADAISEISPHVPAASSPTGAETPETVSDDWLDEAFVFIEQQRFKFL